jgi:hypothetical protein
VTSQYDFSHDQWKLLATTPLLVGMAVARAEDSGFFGSIRETRTLLADLQAGVADGQHQAAASLITQASGYDYDDAFQAYKAMPPEALASDATRACGELALVLASVAEPAEATSYKQWILAVADHVAQAAREDGVRVSAGETDVLEAVSGALGIEPS